MYTIFGGELKIRRFCLRINKAEARHNASDRFLDTRMLNLFMKSFFPPLAVLTFCLTSISALADWPQWRGPERNGTASAKSALPDTFAEDYELTKRWETSDEIPSDHYGGHGSVIAAEGMVYLSLVWHQDEPTETRKIDSDVLSTLGYRGVRSIGEETVKAMEHERLNLSRRLRGAALDEWAQNWVETNLDKKTQLSLGSWVVGRFKKGKAAIPLSVYDTLQTVSKKEFANQSEVEAWVNAQGFDPVVRDQIIKAIPATKKVANDVILCLSGEDGSVIWRFETGGKPSGRGSSSTPCFAEGKVIAALSENIYCVDAKTGDEIWRAPLEGKSGPASSPLVSGDTVFIQQNRLTAFDLATGEERWSNTEIKGANASPAIWNGTVLCNSQKEFFGVDAVTGETQWKRPGGGDATPVVSGDYVIVTSKIDGKNLVAYQLSEAGPEELWAQAFLARRYGSSPIVFEDAVYHLGSERHLCLDLKSGKILWERKAQSSISSPLLVGGKLLVYENRGGFISVIAARKDEYEQLARTKVGALYCASPALVGKDLFFRTAKSVSSLRFE